TASAQAVCVLASPRLLARASVEPVNLMPRAAAIAIAQAPALTYRAPSAVPLQLSGPMIRTVAKQARQDAAVVASDLTDAAASLEAAFLQAPTGWFAQGLNEQQLTALENVREETRQMLSDLKGTGDTETEHSQR